MNDLAAYCETLGRQARAAAHSLATATGERKNRWLDQSAAALESQTPQILAANARDLAAAEELGLSKAEQDRLLLTPKRLGEMAAGLREVRALPDPIGRVLDSNIRPNGLQVLKVGVPLGVIFFIYESRPNVTVDAESLLVHRGIAGDFLPRAGAALRERGVQIRGCEQTRRWLPDARPATEQDYAAEYLDLILSVKVVEDLEQAVAHIQRYGSQHTE